MAFTDPWPARHVTGEQPLQKPTGPTQVCFHALTHTVRSSPFSVLRALIRQHKQSLNKNLHEEYERADYLPTVVLILTVKWSVSEQQNNLIFSALQGSKKIVARK